MPEENEGTPSEEQEDVLNISDEDFEAILARENSNADSTDTGDQDTGDTGSQGEGDGKADVDLARDVAGAVKSGMAEVLDAVKNTQPQPGVQPGQPVTDPMKALEDHVTKQIQGSQGLSEDGARFMAQSVMSGLNPVGASGASEAVRDARTLSSSPWLPDINLPWTSFGTDGSRRTDIEVSLIGTFSASKPG